jgi:RNA polymerase sigma-70 factor (ECF subfamily)
VQREDILAKLRERIVLFAASRLSRDIAEDLAQETLVLLYEKYAHVTELEDLLPLSIQIVRYKMAALHRKAERRAERSGVSVDEMPLPDFSSNPADLAERRELLDRLREAIPRMGERCRELFRLKLQGKAFPEIQKEMGASSLNTVYTWDFRCRQNLLELMGGTWEKKK